jgi:site-specific DNA recombinase
MTEIRAVIYARYSSGKQNDRSIEDQAALCHALCERDGLLVIELCADRALSRRMMISAEEEIGW